MVAHRQSDHNRTLSLQNRARITEIQKARYEACVQTYTKIKQVMHSIYTGHILRTVEQARRFEKLIGLVDPTQCKGIL